MTDSQLRDVLDRAGIVTHNIPDRETLERLYIEQSVGIPKSTGPETNAGMSTESGYPNTRSSSRNKHAANVSGTVNDPTITVEGQSNLDDELLQLEATLQKQRRIRQLREELALLTVADPAVVQPHVAAPAAIQPQVARPFAEDLANAVDIFSGDDRYTVGAFVINFESAAQQFGWSEAQMAVYAKRYISGTAKSLLRTVRTQTWADIRRELQTEFGSAMSASAVHKMLANRHKEDGETVQQYSIAMREIASMGEVDEADLVSYIVDGLARDKSERLFLAGATNFNELRSLLVRYNEMVVKKDIVPPVVITHPVRRNPFSGEIHQQSSKAQRLRCFNCNEVGHFASSCPQRQTKQVANVTYNWRDEQLPTTGCCQGCLQSGRKINIESEQQNEPSRDASVPKQQSTAVNVDRGSIDSKVGYMTDNNFNEGVSLNLYNGKEKVTIGFTALMDTGSPTNLVQAKFVPSAFLKDPIRGVEFVGLNGSRLHIVGSISGSIIFRGRSSDDNILHVVKDNTMRSAAILGRSFMRKNFLELVEKPKSSLCVPDDVDEFLNIDVSDNQVEPEYEVNGNIPNDVQVALRILIDSCDSKSLVGLGSENTPIQCTIKLLKDEQFYCRPRRLSYFEKNEVRKILDDLLEQGIIRPSQSQYSSPIVLVKKKSGTIRMCVDYRTLNKLTLRDNYPLPLIEDQIDLLHNKRFFSCLDLKNGFHHVLMSPESIPLTSFVTPHGQFEYTRMPFGLKNAPSVFQRFINFIFRDLIDNNKILLYMDDIMVATNNIIDHQTILNEVFQLIRKHGLNLNWSKCKFFLQKIDYLGYCVDFRGILPNPANLEAVRGFPAPKNVREVHSFLGLCSYFRKFIKGFALIAKPLYDLLKKDAVFQFTTQENDAFEFLKKCLLASPVLSIYSPDDETELHCDASAKGYGAILLQRKNDNKFHPIFYFSKRTTEAESKYHSFELETLAIIEALKRFRVYLHRIPFKIVTDCNSLALTLNKKQINTRIARWAMELASFSYEVEHRSNERMRHVDSLSRVSEINIVEPNSFEQVLAVEQGRDPIIEKLRNSLENGSLDSSSFELTDGLVYKIIDSRSLFYVPSSMEQNVIRANHDDCGHFGVDKVCSLIREVYWFPHIRKKVKTYIRDCLKCVQFSPKSGKVEGDLHSIPKGDLPFHTIHIDHLGPLGLSNKKHKHILVVVDGFSKFLKLYPVRTTSSSETISALLLYFQAYSRPLRIVSDRGTAFTSREFENFVDAHNITHIKVATASPQSNGQVERFNRDIIPLLAKITTGEEWNKKLGEAEFAFNNTKNRSIGNSPCMLLFGVNQRGEVNDKIREILVQNMDGHRDRDLVKIREKAVATIAKTQNANKLAYDSAHKSPHKYNLNDLVMVSNYDVTPGVNKKMLPKYRGPYRVSQVLPNDRYIVEDVDNWQITQRPYKGTHAPAQMRPWIRTV